MIFRDRTHASTLLATMLITARIKTRPDPEMPTVVVGLPGGGVPVAAGIANKLHAPIDILVSKKIVAHDNPEFALGAVSSTGTFVINTSLPQEYLQRQSDCIESERLRLLESTAKKERQIREAAGIEQVDVQNKKVIVVDDGIATGMTTLAALRTMRHLGASYVVLATPVIARQTLANLCTECDLAVAVQVPEDLSAVGLYYEDFHQLEDDEVVDCLRAVPKTFNEGSSPL